jgi:PIN domain nuclease of toxin-antitoxin system
MVHGDIPALCLATSLLASRLGPKSRLIVLAARDENQLAISAVSFWEIALLVSQDRIEIRYRPAELRVELLDTGIVELALTGDIALLAVELKNLHGDPADRFIVATALAHLRSSQRTLGCRAGVAR